MSRPRVSRKKSHALNSRKDSLDFRDWIYQPALLPLKATSYPNVTWIHILDQGEDGACTGFGLAAVINYLIRARGGRKSERVSPQMLYCNAKRHDQWPGTRYEGSSARGAMKGWYKNGACAEKDWVDDCTPEARESALRHPLGAFYRVLPKRSDMHAALNEVQVVFASAATHKGWDDPGRGGVIEHNSKWSEQGGHAFAIVGYTEKGFIIQNSWSPQWGGVRVDGRLYKGCALWLYEDFDRNLWDAWVAQLARPFESFGAFRFSTGRRAEYTSTTMPAHKAPPREAIRDHFIHIDDGQFDPKGDYFSTREDTQALIDDAFDSGAKHIVLYAHGGMNDVKGSASRVFKWQPVFKRNDAYDIHIVWETGLWEEIRDILLGKESFVRGRAAGLSDWTDRWFERVTGPLGRPLWTEMRSDAEVAFRGNDVAGAVVVGMLRDAMARARKKNRAPQLHLVCHSAGSIFHGHLLHRCRAVADGINDITFRNLILLAPACTHDFFGRIIKPAVDAKIVEQLVHFHLDKKTELDDNVGGIYRKSILYLVSRSYQAKGKVVPIMGLEEDLAKLPTDGVKSRIRTYNTLQHRSITSSPSHGGFDNDLNTMNSVLREVLGKDPSKPFTAEDLQGY